MTNCTMPPEKSHTHLSVILTSMDGKAESFYRLLITWANIVKDQFGSAGILSNFKDTVRFYCHRFSCQSLKDFTCWSYCIPNAWVLISALFSPSYQLQSLFLKFLWHILQHKSHLFSPFYLIKSQSPSAWSLWYIFTLHLFPTAPCFAPTWLK